MTEGWNLSLIVRIDVVLDGRGLTVHYGFRRQIGSQKGHALLWTDALGRYRAYANENICVA